MAMIGNLMVENVNTIAGQALNFNEQSRNKGIPALQNFNSLIETLNNNWKGSDAVTQISGLCSLYDALFQFVKDSIAVSAEVCGDIKAMSDTNRSSGGDGYPGAASATYQSVSGEVPSNATKPQATDSQFINEGFSNGLELIDSCKSAYTSFVEEFESAYTALTGNWTSGGGHDQLVQSHDNFKNIDAEYSSYFDTAREHLSIAISNWESYNNR